jgi:hypothetical protein
VFVPKARARARGPVLWVTTPGLLEHFGLDGADNSPDLDEVRAEGLLDFVTAAAVDNGCDANKGIAGKGRNLRGTTPLLLHCLARTYRERRRLLAALPNAPMFFTFPDDARWNAERQAVEFDVEIGEHHGVVRVPRRVFQRLLPDTPTPERCVEARHLLRTRFERAAERKLRRRQLTEDGNVEITGRDLHEGSPMHSRSAQMR